VGLFDRLRRKATGDAGHEGASTPETPPPALTSGEQEALASLMERVGESTPLTGAYEVDQRGRVTFEAFDGGTVSSGNNLAEEVAALVRGRHYTRWVDSIRQLKRDGHVDDALTLALECVDATEREGRVSGLSPAPAYTEMAAIIYRQRGDLDLEIAIIERYLAVGASAVTANPGAFNGKLAERLEKAKALRMKQKI
jgi:hypothetical protein